MSLTRHLLREFRPLFRMLEEPLGRTYGPGSLTALPRTANNPFAIFNDPFFANTSTSLPAVDIQEDGNTYVVEAELPGVKKENVELRIGDGGQSLTIEGRTFFKGGKASEAPKAIEGREGETQSVTTAEGSEGKLTYLRSAPSRECSPSTTASQAVTQSTAPTQISSERTFTGESSFSRTIWLPRRVDGSNVSAKMEDGILTIRIPKVEDSQSVKVNID